MNYTKQLDLKKFLGYVGEKEVRVMIYIHPMRDSESKVIRSDFQDKADYRRALIKEKAEHCEVCTTSVVNKGKELGLKCFPLYLSHTVIATGKASQILVLLEEPQIESAILDSPICFISPLSLGMGNLKQKPIPTADDF